MKSITVDIVNRDLTTPVILPRVEFQVMRYSDAAIGGSYECEIRASGSDSALWELFDLLRCGIDIRDDHGGVVWSGYVNEVEVIAVSPFSSSTNPIKQSVSLDQMFNRVAVAYTKLNTDGVLERATTDYTDDAFSQATYGVKEYLASATNLSTTAAEQGRDTLLNQKKLPVPQIGFRENLPSRATIRCLGWWYTLNWRYAKVLTTGEIDTATQTYNLITTYEQFFQSTQLQLAASLVDSTEYREGDNTAMYEIEKLLTVGTSNDRRILARITNERRCEIYEEPDSSVLYLQRSDGTIYDQYGVRVRNEAVIAGYWVQLADVMPPSINLTSISTPELRFIELVEYDVTNDELNFKYRDALDPFEQLNQLIERNIRDGGGLSGGDEVNFTGHQHTYSEDWTAQVDGTRTTFITANEFEEETSEIIKNGVEMRLNVDYTEGATFDTIILTTAPIAGDELLSHYIMAFEVPA